MGRFSGFRYRDITERLQRFGFEFQRQGAGSHEIWKHPETGRWTLVPRHPGDLAEGTVRSIVKQTGIEPDDFLAS